MRQESFETVCSFDPGVDKSKVALDTFVQFCNHRDNLDDLRPAFTTDGPTLFTIREIPRYVMRNFVMRGVSEDEKHLRAFMCGVASAKNVMQSGGTRVDELSGTETKKIDGRQFDVWSERDLDVFSVMEIEEIGAAAYAHSFFSEADRQMLCAAAYVASRSARHGLPACGIEPHLAGHAQRKAIGVRGSYDSQIGHDSDTKMRARRKLRQSYACDCSGSLPPGRREPKLGEPFRMAVFQWLGEAQQSCPWRAFRDPFVARVLDAYRWFESGQVAMHDPDPSNRLVEGIAFYHRALNICQSQLMELDREQAKKNGNS
jgi:hypothetical protein